MTELSKNNIQDNYSLMLQIVARFNKSYYNEDDLIFLGTQGLLESAEKFNAKGDFRNYAVKCIRGMLLNGIAQIKKDKIKKINIEDVCLENTDSELSDPLNFLIIQENELILKKYLDQYLAQLSNSEKEVLVLNFFKDMNLSKISRKLNLTVARISQIKKSALRKLKDKLSRTEYFNYLY